MWRYEFQNILAMAIRTRQITPEQGLLAWRNAAAQMADNEQEPSPEKAIDLAARYRITGYDANFIALAMEMGVLYVTEDGELHRKLPAIAVSMADFVKPCPGAGEVREARAPYRTHRRKPASGP